jgi:hypothetical protein
MPGTDLKLYDLAQPRLCENGLANEVVSIVGQEKQRVHALAASSAVCVPLINPVPVTPAVRMTLVHMGTLISPLRVEAREALIGACQAPEIGN